MIEVFDALGWLNVSDDRSCLDPETNRLVQEARKMSQSDGRVRRILERLRNTGMASRNILEEAEISLHRAAVEHSRGWFSEAARHAHRAVIAYKGDQHRYAVALWILGVTQWSMHQHHDAYRNCDHGRKIFQNFQLVFQHLPDQKDWYRNAEWQMNVDLVTRPEEPLTWLNCFEGSSLRPATQQIVSCAQEKIRQGCYPNIYMLMQDLQKAQRLSKQAYEKAEIYLEFGLAFYHLGNITCAIDLLRKSVLHFFPGTERYHKQVVARCMLGALEWMDKAQRNQAAADWRRGAEEFETLMVQADCDRNLEKKRWYKDHRDMIRAALSERLPQH